MQLVTLISKTTVLPQKPWSLRWSWIWTWWSKTNKNDHTTEKNPDVKLPASQYVATQIRRGHQTTNSTQFPLRINYIIWELAKLIWLLFFTKKDSRNKAIICKFYIYTDTHTEYRACHCFGYLERNFSVLGPFTGEGGDRIWDGWMASSIHQWSLSKLQEMVKDWEAQGAAVHGVTKSQTWLSEWQQGAFTAKTIYAPPCIFLPQLSACFLTYRNRKENSDRVSGPLSPSELDFCFNY